MNRAAMRAAPGERDVAFRDLEDVRTWDVPNTNKLTDSEIEQRASLFL